MNIQQPRPTSMLGCSILSLSALTAGAQAQSHDSHFPLHDFTGSPELASVSAEPVESTMSESEATLYLSSVFSETANLVFLEPPVDFAEGSEDAAGDAQDFFGELLVEGGLHIMAGTIHLLDIAPEGFGYAEEGFQDLMDIAIHMQDAGRNLVDGHYDYAAQELQLLSVLVRNAEFCGSESATHCEIADAFHEYGRLCSILGSDRQVIAEILAEAHELAMGPSHEIEEAVSAPLAFFEAGRGEMFNLHSEKEAQDLADLPALLDTEGIRETLSLTFADPAEFVRWTASFILYLRAEDLASGLQAAAQTMATSSSSGSCSSICDWEDEVCGACGVHEVVFGADTKDPDQLSEAIDVVDSLFRLKKRVNPGNFAVKAWRSIVKAVSGTPSDKEVKKAVKGAISSLVDTYPAVWVKFKFHCCKWVDCDSSWFRKDMKLRCMPRISGWIKAGGTFVYWRGVLRGPAGEAADAAEAAAATLRASFCDGSQCE